LPKRSRKEKHPVRIPVLLGIALAACGLLMFLSMLLLVMHETFPGPEEHPFRELGWWLSVPPSQFLLGHWFSLVFPLILLQVAWNLVRENALSQFFSSWFRQILLSLAASLSLFLILETKVDGVHTLLLDQGWQMGLLPNVLMHFLMKVASYWGALIMLVAFDLIVLAIVFHLHPEHLIDLISALFSSIKLYLHSRLHEWKRALAYRREEARRKKQEKEKAKKEARDEKLRLVKEQEAAARVAERARIEEGLRLREQSDESSTSNEDDAEPCAEAGADTNAPGQTEPAPSAKPDFLSDESDDGGAPEDEEFDITDETIEKERRFKAKPKSTYHYKLPSVDLLNDPPLDEYHVTEEDMQLCSDALISCLKDFNVEAKVVHVHPGPVITRYDLEPAPGVKVSRIASLADDLAMKLKAERIRIIAPVPGKGAVGVELPNKERNTVFLKQIVNTKTFINATSPLSVALGKTSSGESAVADLRAMPHVLIAGQTGAGKSVCINGVICSILLRALPTEVQFVMIDPKMIELSDYKRIARHFIAEMDGIDGEVVTDPQDAVRVLAALEKEMDNRYRHISQTGYRSIQEFNEAIDSGEMETRIEAGELWLVGQSEEDPVPDKMVYLVVIVDELADLMMTAGKDVETSIARLAQKARAVGIHLVVATQRPSVDVLTGLIKANFPARIAFAVRQKVDSKTILDCMGADQLLGKGDMLYLASGSPEPVRMHNALLTGKEIRDLLDHIRKQSLDFKKFALPMEHPEEVRASIEEDDRDELFMRAAEIVIQTGQGSVSVLQRKLRIGHSRASRLIDQLEVAGVVGGFDGSKARQVVVDVDWLEERGFVK
jgi:DNA segregation ATPase FtsK/SpoIIIE, S-DNA-T family